MLIAKKYDSSGAGRPDRSRVIDEIHPLAVRMAKGKPSWGYTCIKGELANLGHEVVRGTVANIVTEDGIKPAPECGRLTTWKLFLRSWGKRIR